MSSSNEQGDNLASRDFLPHEPLYYAPSSWLQRLRPASSPPPLASSARPAAATARPALTDAFSSPGSLDAELEHAVYEALRRPREPLVMAEPPGFLGDLDRRIRLISIAGRIAVAIGVSAIAALIFVLMGVGSRDYATQSDGASVGAVLPIKSALSNPPPSDEEAKPALCELQTILGPPQAQPVMTRQESETLLQQFMQWREKPTLAKTP